MKGCLSVIVLAIIVMVSLAVWMSKKIPPVAGNPPTPAPRPQPEPTPQPSSPVVTPPALVDIAALRQSADAAHAEYLATRTPLQQQLQDDATFKALVVEAIALEAKQRNPDPKDRAEATKRLKDVRRATDRMVAALDSHPSLVEAKRKADAARQELAKAEEAERQREAERAAIVARKDAARARILANRMHFADLALEKVGVLADACEVIQVIGDDAVLVALGDSAETVIIRGFATRGVVTGKRFALNDPVIVRRTRTYQSLLGQRTVFELEPYPLP